MCGQKGDTLQLKPEATCCRGVSIPRGMKTDPEDTIADMPKPAQRVFESAFRPHANRSVT
jgi:hypothetical protein